MDTSRRHKISGPETKEFITAQQVAWALACLLWFPLLPIPQWWGRGPKGMLHIRMGLHCSQGTLGKHCALEQAVSKPAVCPEGRPYFSLKHFHCKKNPEKWPRWIVRSCFLNILCKMDSQGPWQLPLPTLTCFGHWLHTTRYSKFFSCLVSFHQHTNSVSHVPLLSLPSYR